MTKCDPLIEGYLLRRRQGKPVTTELLSEDNDFLLDDDEIEVVSEDHPVSVARVLAEEAVRRWALRSADENISIETTPAPARKLTAQERVVRAKAMNWGGEDE